MMTNKLWLYFNMIIDILFSRRSNSNVFDLQRVDWAFSSRSHERSQHEMSFSFIASGHHFLVIRSSHWDICFLFSPSLFLFPPFFSLLLYLLLFPFFSYHSVSRPCPTSLCLLPTRVSRRSFVVQDVCLTSSKSSKMADPNLLPICQGPDALLWVWRFLPPSLYLPFLLIYAYFILPVCFFFLIFGMLGKNGHSIWLREKHLLSTDINWSCCIPLFNSSCNYLTFNLSLDPRPMIRERCTASEIYVDLLPRNTFYFFLAYLSSISSFTILRV